MHEVGLACLMFADGWFVDFARNTEIMRMKWILSVQLVLISGLGVFSFSSVPLVTLPPRVITRLFNWNDIQPSPERTSNKPCEEVDSRCRWLVQTESSTERSPLCPLPVDEMIFYMTCSAASPCCVCGIIPVTCDSSYLMLPCSSGLSYLALLGVAVALAKRWPQFVYYRLFPLLVLLDNIGQCSQAGNVFVITAVENVGQACVVTISVGMTVIDALECFANV